MPCPCLSSLPGWSLPAQPHRLSRHPAPVPLPCLAAAAADPRPHEEHAGGAGVPGDQSAHHGAGGQHVPRARALRARPRAGQGGGGRGDAGGGGCGCAALGCALVLQRGEGAGQAAGRGLSRGGLSAAAVGCCAGGRLSLHRHRLPTSWRYLLVQSAVRLLPHACTHADSWLPVSLALLPADAVNLAVRFGAAIYVNKEVRSPAACRVAAGQGAMRELRGSLATRHAAVGALITHAPLHPCCLQVAAKMSHPVHMYEADPHGGGTTEQHSDVVRSCRCGWACTAGLGWWRGARSGHCGALLRCSCCLRLLPVGLPPAWAAAAA